MTIVVVVMMMIILARLEFCEISLKYFAYNLKSLQPIADLKIAIKP